jgi:hypothetical protein
MGLVVSLPGSTALKTRQKFMDIYYRYLEECRNFNELNDLPEAGWEWHHILPKCLFDDQPPGLWLTKEQHAKASVLQSYAFKTCCVTGWMKKHLPEKWVPFWYFWKKESFLNNRFSEEGIKNWMKSLSESNWNNDEVNKRRGKSISDTNKDPVSQKKRAQAAKKTQNDPKVKAKHAEVNMKPEVRARRTQAQTGLVFFVNAEGKTCRRKECPGPEWQRGRKWRP